jgi:hypothetical protein
LPLRRCQQAAGRATVRSRRRARNWNIRVPGYCYLLYLSKRKCKTSYCALPLIVVSKVISVSMMELRLLTVLVCSRVLSALLVLAGFCVAATLASKILLNRDSTQSMIAITHAPTTTMQKPAVYGSHPPAPRLSKRKHSKPAALDRGCPCSVTKLHEVRHNRRSIEARSML